MIIQHIYSFLFKRGILPMCLLAGSAPVLAQSLILTQPVSRTICKTDGAVVFQVVTDPNHPNVGGSTNYHYNWYINTGAGWTQLSGASGQFYTAGDAGSYYCEVQLGDIIERTVVVTLTINAAPFISIDAIRVEPVCAGDNLTAGVTQVLPNGTPLTDYTWTLNGVVIETGSVVNNTVPGVTRPNMDVSLHDKELMLTVTNGCGQVSASVRINVWGPPDPPRPGSGVRDYCQGETAIPLSITETTPVWYNVPTGGTPLQQAPVPVTSTAGSTQTWWVSQRVWHHDNAVCESERREVTVTIHHVPAPPATIPVAKDTVLCVNDATFTPRAQGTGIKWYNDRLLSIAAPQQINTSISGTQIFYATQTVGRCESRMDEGKITVRITGRSEADRINLPENYNLCPNTGTIIAASSQVQNPVFRWYKNDNKTELIHTGPTIETGILKRDTVYYVTIEYGGLCESGYAKPISIFVRDIEPPRIIVPPNVIVSTDDGVCYATNVDIGRPVISDNCTDMDKLILYTDPAQPGVFPTTFLLGDTTLTWVVMDESQRWSRGYQNISVRDREKPRGTCPGNIEVLINDHETSATVFYTLNYTDNCSAVKDSLVLGFPSGSVFPLGETRVRRFLIDDAGNQEICEFKVIVGHPYRPPIIDLRISRSSICPGELVEIIPDINGGSGRFTYSWRQPFNWTEAVMRDYPSVNTRYEVTIDDGVSPPQTLQTEIRVLEKRRVALTLEGYSNMDEIFEGEEVLVTATSGFESYKLLLNDKEIQTSGLNSGVSFQAELGIYTVQVFATESNGCVSQDRMTIPVDSRKLPNVFTPNFDGKNDLFLEGFDLEVYSRAGELLYKGVDGWDGTYKGKIMQQGTYLYTVRRIMNNGELRIIKNTVTIKH